LLQQAEESLAIHDVVVSSEAVLQLVNSSHCSAYDCEFIAAAQQLKLSLCTEDLALLAAFPAIAQPLM
jgi:predicted nucleic acid-binding protein